MRIGLDFDNTIVCYDQAIKQLADELLELPEDVPRTKLGLRDHLRAAGREPQWTAFQGELYGPGMRYAQPYKDSIATMKHLVAVGHELVIISHRSRRPYAGPRHDLHAAARGWVLDRLQSEGLFRDAGDETRVHFLENRNKKLAMISKLGCDVFLDDLPDILSDPEFPKTTQAILFDPAGDISIKSMSSKTVITSWSQLLFHLEF